MTRYHALSQRAAGAASRSPSQPKPPVMWGGSYALREDPSPKIAAAPTPTSHTSKREVHSARQLIRRAPRRAGSLRRRASGPASGAVNRGRTASGWRSRGTLPTAGETSAAVSSALRVLMGAENERSGRGLATGRRTQLGTVISKLVRCLDNPACVAAGAAARALDS